MSETQTVREFLRANISQIIAVIDDHDPGIYQDTEPRMFRCPCGYMSTEAEWEQHIGELVGEKLAADLPDLVLL